MRKVYVKGLEPLLLKQVALLIGICYLIYPLHQQVRTALHTISHCLEIPGYIIPHDTIVGPEGFSHVHNKHEINSMYHNHYVLDLIDGIFKNINKKSESSETFLSKTKLDKYLFISRFELYKFVEPKIPHGFSIVQKKSLKGFFNKLKEPPKYPIG